MAEPEEIVARVRQILTDRPAADEFRADRPAATAWRDRRVIVTAGPTHEALDPVRYLANRSTGAFGFALAAAAVSAGARVVLISGPTVELPPRGRWPPG